MKKTIMTDVRLELECPGVTRYLRSPESRERALRAWVKEFQGFLRDHRSQDEVVIDVVPVMEDVCSFCWYEWEVDDDGAPACCQEAVDEHEQLLAAITTPPSTEGEG